MSNIEKVLSCLPLARKTAHNRYMAPCPAHDDISPSLQVTDVGDSRVLLHCFAGCSWDSILGSLGLEPSDVYPENTNYAPVKTSKDPSLDEWKVKIGTGMARSGKRLTEAQKQEVIQAKLRLARAG
jgi:hypothetical protein